MFTIRKICNFAAVAVSCSLDAVTVDGLKAWGAQNWRNQQAVQQNINGFQQGQDQAGIRDRQRQVDIARHLRDAAAAAGRRRALAGALARARADVTRSQADVTWQNTQISNATNALNHHRSNHHCRFCNNPNQHGACRTDAWLLRQYNQAVNWLSHYQQRFRNAQQHLRTLEAQDQQHQHDEDTANHWVRGFQQQQADEQQRRADEQRRLQAWRGGVQRAEAREGNDTWASLQPRITQFTREAGRGVVHQYDLQTYREVENRGDGTIGQQYLQARGFTAAFCARPRAQILAGLARANVGTPQ